VAGYDPFRLTEIIIDKQTKSGSRSPMPDLFGFLVDFGRGGVGVVLLWSLGSEFDQRGGDGAIGSIGGSIATGFVVGGSFPWQGRRRGRRCFPTPSSRQRVVERLATTRRFLPFYHDWIRFDSIRLDSIRLDWIRLDWIPSSFIVWY